MKPVRPTDLAPESDATTGAKITRRSLLLGGAGFATVSGAAVAGYSGAEAATMLNVTRYRLRPRGWPAALRLSITVIADLHSGGPNMGLARVRDVVDAANGLQSDIVLLLGDFIATHRFVTEAVPPAVWASELARLRAPLGIHSILGNHDWWFMRPRSGLRWRRSKFR